MIGIRQAALAVLCLSLLPSAASGQEVGVFGRDVALRVLTFDDPQTPMFESRVHTSTVVDGIEFGVDREGRPGLDVVPVIVDVQGGSIAFSYRMLGLPGAFTRAAFNGYELSFSPCLGFHDIGVVSAHAMAMGPQRVWSVDNRIYVNVSALNYTPDSHFTVSFTAHPCPSS